jgi:hypothetical protein
MESRSFSLKRLLTLHDMHSLDGATPLAAVSASTQTKARPNAAARATGRPRRAGTVEIICRPAVDEPAALP